MGSTRSKKNSTPEPKAPDPTNENYYENGVLKSSRIYDAGTKTYNSNAYSTPQEQAIENQATDYMGQLVNEIPDAVNLSPEAMQQYRDAYAEPQINALTDSYNQAKGQATMAASGRGMRNSVGFNKYLANNIEKNKAQGLADIESNAYLQGLDLPNKMLMPYANQFNLYNAATQGQQANMAQNFEPAFQGSQAGSNFALQNYNNQMNQWKANQQNQNRGGGGMFSFFTG